MSELLALLNDLDDVTRAWVASERRLCGFSVTGSPRTEQARVEADERLAAYQDARDRLRDALSDSDAGAQS